MAGFIPYAGVRPNRDNRPSMPIVDRALVGAMPPFIMPVAAKPWDFEAMPAEPERVLPTMAYLMRVTCVATKTSRAELLSLRREANVVKARQLCMWLCRFFTALSYPQIGTRLQRDHTTVLHGVRRVQSVIEHFDVVVVDDPQTMALWLWGLSWPTENGRRT